MHSDIQPTIDGLLAMDDPVALHAVEIIRQLMSQHGPAADGELTVDLVKNIVTRRDRSVKVSPHQAVIVYKLLQAKDGTGVTSEQLQSALYGRRGPEHNVGTLRVQITDLRKRMAPLRVWIPSSKGRGYRLAFSPIQE